uniref:Uncharacterized protein n=1 Tax=Bracon brevicornis TaxID=1563983 RepID=A0A6V7JDV5_9HYME
MVVVSNEIEHDVGCGSGDVGGRGGGGGGRGVRTECIYGPVVKFRPQVPRQLNNMTFQDTDKEMIESKERNKDENQCSNVKFELKNDNIEGLTSHLATIPTGIGKTSLTCSGLMIEETQHCQV